MKKQVVKRTVNTEKVAVKIQQTEVAIRRWERRFALAGTKLAKLRSKRNRLAVAQIAAAAAAAAGAVATARAFNFPAEGGAK